jgi:hypothetical protein
VAVMQRKRPQTGTGLREACLQEKR